MITLTPQHHTWIQNTISKKYGDLLNITPLPEHADHRRYWRILMSRKPFIYMQTSPKFDMQKFIHSTAYLEKNRVPVANIIASNPALHCLILEDLGQTSLLNYTKKKPHSYLPIYKKSIDLLHHWQSITTYPNTIPNYTSQIAKDNANLCIQWFCQTWAEQPLSKKETYAWNEVIANISRVWEESPTALCHRDYHSDNIMIQGNQLKVLDYQDLAIGPIHYDLASLLTDHYYSHTPKTQQTLIQYAVQKQGIPFDHRTFYTIVYQRHLKNLGVFSRLHHRDQKSQYLKYIPRMLQTMEYISGHIPDFSVLTQHLIGKYIYKIRKSQV